MGGTIARGAARSGARRCGPRVRCADSAGRRQRPMVPRGPWANPRPGAYIRRVRSAPRSPPLSIDRPVLVWFRRPGRSSCSATRSRGRPCTAPSSGRSCAVPLRPGPLVDELGRWTSPWPHANGWPADSVGGLSWLPTRLPGELLQYCHWTAVMPPRAARGHLAVLREAAREAGATVTIRTDES